MYNLLRYNCHHNILYWQYVFFFLLTVYQVWFSNRRARLRKQMSSNTGSSTPGSGGYGMGLALGYSPSAQQQNQQQPSGPNSSSTPAYIMSPQQLHEPYNTPDEYKGILNVSNLTEPFFFLLLLTRSDQNYLNGREHISRPKLHTYGISIYYS